ncbi:MAG TPA: histidinol dehydrogenase [Lentisphaeria bacterium]|nr:histidinol dehydrogenase [Lentisphaeria bacterium]
MQFPIYTPAEASAGILHRAPIGDGAISPTLAAGLQRVFGEPLGVEEAVARILQSVRNDGDTGLRVWTERIDGSAPETFVISAAEIKQAYETIDPALRDALHFSADRIRAFHERQRERSWVHFEEHGGALGQLIRPLSSVGVYAPGGTAPYPSTLLMGAVTARVAGVERVVVATPAGRDGIAPVILAAAHVAEVDEVYAVGGAQAVGALAYGTETITAVDKIVGPGNIFVVTAKRQVFGMVDIDSLPGPTETLVVADANADPVLVAADLLAQAEHDTQSAAILVTPSRDLAEAVQTQIASQLEPLTRKAIIEEALQQSGAVICADLAAGVALSNGYGPEHLCLHVDHPWELLGTVTNAGGVFLGEHAYEVLGDYTAGPTHVMPTMGTARFASPLSTRDFTKIISIFGMSEAESRAIAPAAQLLAESEGLTAHANAVRLRLESR